LSTIMDMNGILAIFRRFSQFEGQTTSDALPAYETTAATRVREFHASKQPLSMLLPAFPWKNPNTEKTLSSDPDFGEELAMARLNHMCEELSIVYPFGAEATLVADGPVYNGT
jgi:pyoverdine/dityrosine biosynthesis protein Dit1